MSLARGLEVLRHVVNASGPLTIAEAARRTGISRAATRRCLYTLAQTGYVAQSDQGFVALNERYSLGSSFIGAGSLASRAAPMLELLRDELGESCSIGVLDGDHVRYIARAQASRIMSINLNVGSRLPLYATSMGRVLLSGRTVAERIEYLNRTKLNALTGRTVTDHNRLLAIFEETRSDGYSLVDQELEIGLTSMSVPVKSSGRVIAALNVGCAVSRVTTELMLAHFLPKLRNVAEALGD